MFGALVAGIAAGVATVGAALTAGLSTIGGIAVSAGTSIAAFASTAIGIIATHIPDIERAIRIIGIVSSIIQSISKMLGSDMKDDPEELGYKALHAEKKAEDFDDIDEYINYLNNEIRVDKNKMNQMKPEEKATCQVVGSAIQCASIGKQLQVNIPPESYAGLALLVSDEKIQTYFGEGEELCKNIIALVKELKGAGIIDLKDVDDYLKDSGDFDKRHNTGEALIKSLEKMELGEDTVDILEDFSDVVQGVKKY